MTSKVEVLLERLLRVDKTPLYCAGGKCGFTEGKHIPTRAELEELVAEGVAEGAEQERERIRKAGNKAVVLHDGTLFVDEDMRKRYAKDGNVFIVPASVLAPKESDK